MSVEYVSQDEIEAHKAAMQQMLEDAKKEHEEVNDKKMRSIEEAGERMKEAIMAAEEKMRQKIMEAKQATDRAIKGANDLAERQLKQSKEKILAMQRDFERLPLLRQVYHEAPNEVFELIVSKRSKLDELGWVKGGFNLFRLVNKRCKQVVESCTTRLINEQRREGPEYLPISLIQRCKRIEHIECTSRNLMSLEGCPSGLTTLWIDDAHHLSDLSPLASCSLMKCLKITDSAVTNISVVASKLRLEIFYCVQLSRGRPSIKDLSPLSSCPRLRKLSLLGNKELKDISPLSACTGLENLHIGFCPLIISLTPLSNLKNLIQLFCPGIDPQTSLLPVASCTGLKELWCSKNAVDLDELRRRSPQIQVRFSRKREPGSREGYFQD